MFTKIAEGFFIEKTARGQDIIVNKLTSSVGTKSAKRKIGDFIRRVAGKEQKGANIFPDKNMGTIIGKPANHLNIQADTSYMPNGNIPNNSVVTNPSGLKPWDTMANKPTNKQTNRLLNDATSKFKDGPRGANTEVLAFQRLAGKDEAGKKLWGNNPVIDEGAGTGDKKLGSET